MHPSLLNQFRGAYLGAALGDVLGCSVFAWNNPNPDAHLSLGAIALAYTRDLLGATAHPLDEENDGHNTPLVPLQAMAAQVALGLPGAVYFHDDLTEFQRQMAEQRDRWCPTLAKEPRSELQLLDDGLLLLALLVAAVLQQRLDPTRAIAPLRSELERLGRSPLLLDYLRCIEEQLNQHQPLAIAQLHLEHLTNVRTPAQTVLLALVLALYLALTSLTDLPVTLCRIQVLTSRTVYTSLPLEFWTFQRLLSFVAGLIVGAYNGLEGIPLAWRHCLTTGAYRQAQDVPPGVMEKTWGVGSEIELLQLVDPLFAQWSGADEGSRFLTAVSGLAIASPPTA